MPRLSSKTRRLILGLALVAVVLAVPFGNAWAQTESSNILTQAIGEVGKSTSGLTIATILFVIGVVAGFLQNLFTAILYYLAYAMDSAFWATAVIDPGTMNVVQVGWTTLRDMANAFFILLLLWIALTIIFNLEDWGGKKLLIRIFLVALLINFSLVIVTTVFGFTNAIAYVFYQKMDPNREGVGQFIIAKTRLQTISQAVARGEIDTYLIQRKQAQENTKTGNGASPDGTGAPLTSDRPRFSDTLLAASGIPQANATPLGGAVGGGIVCGLAALGAAGTAVVSGGTALLATGPIALKACAIGGSLAASIVWMWDILGAAAGQAASRMALYNGSAAILVGLTAYGFLMATIALIVRFIAEIFLSITAPLAFIAYIMPWGKARGLFDKWLEALFKYAFFAPIYFFLIYIALFMIQQADASIDTTVPILLNADRVLMIIMIVIIMVVATRFARDTAGVAGEAAISMGKVAGGALLGLGLGAAGVGVAAASRRLAPGLIKPATEWLSRTPILGQVTAPLTRGVARYFEKQEEDVTTLKKEYEKWNVDNLIDEYHRAATSNRKVAVAQVLAERGKSKDLEATGVKLEDTVRMASRFGRQTTLSLLKFNPSLARPEHFSRAELDELRKKKGYGAMTDEELAKRLSIKEIKQEDASKIPIREEEDIDQKTMQLLWQELTPKHFASMKRDNEGLMSMMNDHLDPNNPRKYKEHDKDLVGKLSADTLKYLWTNASIIGLSEDATDAVGEELNTRKLPLPGQRM